MKLSLYFVVATLTAPPAWGGEVARRTGLRGGSHPDEFFDEDSRAANSTSAIRDLATALTYDNVKAAVQRKGYKFFTGKYNLNLIGIRGPNLYADQWDDVFCVLYQDANGWNQIATFSYFTTDPGTYYLKYPMTTRGCAIVAPGQYRSVWANGLHTGYPALIQTGSISVYRDNNKDAKLDFVAKESGYYGIDLHHGYSSTTVGQNSAGCQVFKYKTDLDTVLGLTTKQKQYGYGSTFSYTLLNSVDIY